MQDILKTNHKGSNIDLLILLIILFKKNVMF